MKCPLFTIGRTDVQLGVESDYGECLKEECAWWEQDLNLCAIKELALELRYTQLRLADMVEKMPPAEQWTKPWR